MHFAPFISLGAHYNSFTPGVELGDDFLDYEAIVLATPQLNDDPRNNIFKSESYSKDPFSTWSINWSIGTRYKLTPLSDLMIDLRWTYYFTDFGDGLNHNGPEDKNYDWNVWFNFGYVYYLD